MHCRNNWNVSACKSSTLLVFRLIRQSTRCSEQRRDPIFARSKKSWIRCRTLLYRWTFEATWSVSFCIVLLRWRRKPTSPLQMHSNKRTSYVFPLLEFNLRSVLDRKHCMEGSTYSRYLNGIYIFKAPLSFRLRWRSHKSTYVYTFFLKKESCVALGAVDRKIEILRRQHWLERKS